MPVDRRENASLLESARSLRQLLDSHPVKDVSRTRLARHSAQVMTEILENQEFLRVQIGTRRMLVVDEEYLRRSRKLLEAVETRLDELDPVLDELRGRFDRLASKMNTASGRKAAHDALFGDDAPAALRENYGPGDTERQP